MATINGSKFYKKKTKNAPDGSPITYYEVGDIVLFGDTTTFKVNNDIAFKTKEEAARYIGV